MVGRMKEAVNAMKKANAVKEVKEEIALNGGRLGLTNAAKRLGIDAPDLLISRLIDDMPGVAGKIIFQAVMFLACGDVR